MKNKVFFFIQAILRYFPFKFGIFLRGLIYPSFFKKCGKNIRIFDSVIIKYPSDIEVGDNFTINQFCYVVGKGGLVIGDNVMLGSGCKIATSTHNFEDVNLPMSQQGISTSAIILGDDVWFGFNVVVLGGSNIGKGSILAAGAVITGKAFEPYSIVAGVPAKFIKSRT